eukprot:TRINITY_DN11700_c0_g1_i1.p1 TRINITY_DN11700_c0_g1~~TRINITY_DN11700_c0_g1_i1.p1  ORF type:complete len:255 (+),score=38.94 TRINITY_DN11700_c0_g1_i1:40-804(+)
MNGISAVFSNIVRFRTSFQRHTIQLKGQKNFICEQMSIEKSHHIHSGGGAVQVLQRFYDEVAVTAFPEGELEPFSEWELMLKEGFPHFEGIVLEVANEVVGGITTERYNNATLLTYLVVKEQHRKKGYGSSLCQKVLVKARESNCPLLLEAHDLTTVDETMDPRTRLAIYQQLGFKKVDIPYTAPSVEPGSANVSGLVLLMLVEDDKSITEWSWLGKFLKEYWDACYSDDNRPLLLMLDLIEKNKISIVPCLDS